MPVSKPLIALTGGTTLGGLALDAASWAAQNNSVGRPSTNVAGLAVGLGLSALGLWTTKSHVHASRKEDTMTQQDEFDKIIDRAKSAVSRILKVANPENVTDGIKTAELDISKGEDFVSKLEKVADEFEGALSQGDATEDKEAARAVPPAPTAQAPVAPLTPATPAARPASDDFSGLTGN